VKEPWIIENCYPIVERYVINIIEFPRWGGGGGELRCYSWIFSEIIMSIRNEANLVLM
jgi:hypothetical protein